MSSYTRVLRREYTGNLSLKTTDHCIKTSLLSKFTPKDSPKPQLTIFENEQFLLELGNVLSSKECVEIIKNADKCIFEDISDKYRFGKQRDSSRLLALDESLAENLWQSIYPCIFNGIADKGVSLQPLGFDVTRGVWDLHGLNEAIRINKYSGERQGYFGPHKDAQFCPNGDQRSIMTLLIYLNEDFKGGETCFYFPKNSTLSLKGMTIKEEIKSHRGLKKGYKCVKIIPKVGHAVLSSQSILHEALPVRNGAKYILKTDVVVKRSLKEFGFSVEECEKKDYMTCLNYFRQAQQQELFRNYDIASDLYEKALSIRYCYPSCINETPKYIDTSGYTRFPPEVWYHVFQFLSGYDVQNVVYAYPELNLVMATWEQRQRNTSLKLSNVGYLPKIRYQKGVVTSFVFPDAELFKEKKNECCRVAAMYSFFLLGHSPQDDIYTVRYNPDTQEVCVVALETLLTDVFYGRRCYGSVYNVRQQDPETRDPKKDFELSVDRNYMLIKHGAEFTGVELPGSFYAKSTVYITTNDEDSNDEGSNNDDDDGEGSSDADDGISGNPSARMPGDYHDNIVPFCGEVDEDIPIDQLVKFMLMSADRNNAMCQDDNDCLNEDILNDSDYVDGTRKYFQAFKEPLYGSSAALVSKLNTPLSFEPGEVCVCFMGPDEQSNDKLAQSCSTEYFNHLVFDFQQSELNVEFLSGPFEEQTRNENWEPECYEEAVLRDMANFGCTGELIRAQVNIEPLLSPDTSFNHASCQCGHPRFELHQFSNLKQYLHLTSLTLYAKEKDGKMIMWTIYDGIVAL
jgi:hypothetical protein